MSSWRQCCKITPNLINRDFECNKDTTQIKYRYIHCSKWIVSCQGKTIVCYHRKALRMFHQMPTLTTTCTVRTHLKWGIITFMKLIWGIWVLLTITFQEPKTNSVNTIPNRIKNLRKLYFIKKLVTNMRLTLK